MKKFRTATMKPKLFPIKGNFSKELINLHKPEASKDRPDRAVALKRGLGSPTWKLKYLPYLIDLYNQDFDDEIIIMKSSAFGKTEIIVDENNNIVALRAT